MPAGALETLADAVEGGRVIEFDYLDAKGARTHRCVEPMGFWFDAALETWSFSAWCRLRQAVRVFRVDRMLSEPMPTGETFVPRPAETPDTRCGSLGSTEQAVLAVHDPAAVGQDAWPGLEVFADANDEQLATLTHDELAHGAFIAQIPWQAESPWLVQEIVATMGGIEALAPASLREGVCAHTRMLLERLG